MLSVGAVSITPLSDGSFSAQPSRFLPSVPAEAWEDERDVLDAAGSIPLNLGCFLIREGDSLTLVDTGIGPSTRMPNAGKLLDALKQAGVEPQAVERVITTHLHFDHIGWNTVERDGVRTALFSNARHVLQQKEWDALDKLSAGAPAVRPAVEPILAAGLLDLVDGDVVLTPCISTLFTPGHTPGHQSVLISSGGEKAIVLGDVSHTPAQLRHPDWNPEADLEPTVSSRTRAALFDRIEREGLTVCAGPYTHPCIGTIVRVEGRRRWKGVDLSG